MITPRYLPLPSIDDIAVAILKNFYERIDYKIIPECWIWIGSHSGDNGYGRRVPLIKINSINYSTTRIIYYHHYKVNPGPLVVCHNCYPNSDNPSCVNPKHLWLGTQSDNLLDYFAKGGQPSFGNQQVSDDQVREIRLAYANGEKIMNLSRKYDLSRWTINKIVHRKTFKHID